MWHLYLVRSYYKPYINNSNHIASWVKNIDCISPVFSLFTNLYLWLGMRFHFNLCQLYFFTSQISNTLCYQDSISPVFIVIKLLMDLYRMEFIYNIQKSHLKKDTVFQTNIVNTLENCLFVELPGFEHRQTESKSVVLPLHHSSIPILLQHKCDKPTINIITVIWLIM